MEVDGLAEVLPKFGLLSQCRSLLRVKKMSMCFARIEGEDHLQELAAFLGQVEWSVFLKALSSFRVVYFDQFSFDPSLF